MSAPMTQAKGRPLLTLAMVLVAWAGLRATTWESPFPEVVSQTMAEYLPSPLAAAPIAAEPLAADSHAAPVHRRSAPYQAHPWAAGEAGNTETGVSEFWSVPASSQIPGQYRLMSAHSALLMSGLAHLPVPAALQRMVSQTDRADQVQAVSSVERGEGKRSRWSGDGWLFWRAGANRSASAAAPGVSRLGGSQAGAVIRYDLLRDAKWRPRIYARASTALQSPREPSLGVGLSARPFPSLPVSVHAEGRVTQAQGGTRINPAAFAVAQLPRTRLPLGLDASAYAQGGYVGGDFATGFVDGQARLERELASFDLAKVRAGAGAWGGAQRDAHRLDVGPTLSADLWPADIPVRVSVDYRVRVAGNADPGSGVAVTLSSGF